MKVLVLRLAHNFLVLKQPVLVLQPRTSHMCDVCHTGGGELM